MSFYVRKALAEDADALCRLMFGFTSFPNQPEDVAARLADPPAYERIYVAVVKKVVQGFACHQMTYSALYPVWHHELTWTYVAPQARRRGVGSALVRAVENAVRKADSHALYIDTDPENVDALAFFTHLGYNQSGERYWRRCDVRPR